jgi:hypothetical protein
MKNKSNKPSDSTARDRERNDALNKNTRENEKDKLPGEYPPQEDIMNRQNMQRVGLDVENFARGVGIENFNKPNEPTITDRNAILEEPDTAALDSLEQPQPDEMERPILKNVKVEEDLDEIDNDFASGNESDVTQEDLQALGPKDLSLDMGDDENLLKNRVWPVDMAGEDLDIPGSELDDQNEAIGSEDEENNSYSIGGDRHEDNLEGK